MKSEFRSELVYKALLGCDLIQLVEPFIYYSEQLGREIIIPVGFICDLESVPLIKGSSKRGGVIHDYLCRIDSDPVVTKRVAADIYKEAQNCKDQMVIKNTADRFWKWVRRNLKTMVVRNAPWYFHKFRVMDMPR